MSYARGWSRGISRQSLRRRTRGSQSWKSRSRGSPSSSNRSPSFAASAGASRSGRRHVSRALRALRAAAAEVLPLATPRPTRRSRAQVRVAGAADRTDQVASVVDPLRLSAMHPGQGGQLAFRARDVRALPGFQRRLSRRGPRGASQQSVGGHLDHVVEHEPRQGVGPHPRRVLPTDRRDQEPVHGDQGAQDACREGRSE